MRISDWSSDVCSSDLNRQVAAVVEEEVAVDVGREHPDAVAALEVDVARRRDLQRSEEHTSELQSLMRISYAVFCLKKKKKQILVTNTSHQYYRTSNDDSKIYIVYTKNKKYTHK